MVTRAELLQAFDADDVIRFREGALEQVVLPPEAREALQEVGVPRRLEPLFESAAPAMVTIPGHDGSVCRFGSDFGTDLCVVPESGEVISASSSHEYPERFVNSSLSQFIACLVKVSIQRAEFRDLADRQINARVRALEADLGRIDRRALSGPDHWWAVIVEQLKDGLL